VVRLSDDRPLFAFAGLWTPWRGVRGTKSAPVEGDHELFGFLTTEANAPQSRLSTGCANWRSQTTECFVEEV